MKIPVDLIEMASRAYEKLGRYLADHPYLRFGYRTSIALIGIVLFCMMFSWVLDLPTGAGWLLVLAILGLIVWIVIRLWQHFGPSSVFAVAVAILILYTIQSLILERDARIALAAFPEAYSPSPAARTLDLGNLADRCTDACIETLAKTGVDIIVGDQVFRLVIGDRCRSEPFQPLYFRFLKAGYAGVCAQTSSVIASVLPAGGIIELSQTYCKPWQYDGGLCETLPRSFGGYIANVLETNGSGTHVLQRWIAGYVRPRNGWFSLIGIDRRPVGKWAYEAGVISRALNVPIQGGGVSGDGDFDIVLTELESFLDNPAYAEDTWHGFRALSYAKGQDNPNVLKSHIVRLIGHADRSYILAGLNLVTSKSRVDLTSLRPRIEELGQSPDPAISDFAQRALRHIEDR